MTELTRYLKDIENYEFKEEEIDDVLNRIMNYPLVEFVGDENKRLTVEEITDFLEADELTGTARDDALRNAIEDSIENLTEKITDQSSPKISKNYGNLWNFLLGEIDSTNFNIKETEEVFNTQLEDYLIIPKFSYYDEKDTFSTKREAIRSYEKIIYNTNVATQKIFNSNIYYEIDQALYNVTTPDQYIYQATPLRYTYLRMLGNNYTVFNDSRDDLLRATFNNRINYLSNDDAYKLLRLLAKKVLYTAKEMHTDYIDSLGEAIEGAFGEMGGAFIDFSKIFDDVTGNYISQLGSASGKVLQLTKELTENYNFNLDSDKNPIPTIIKNVLTECINILKNEGVSQISTIEDIRNCEFVFLLSKFFGLSTDTYPTISELLSDAKKFREKEAVFIQKLLASPDREKFQFTEKYLELYNILKS